MSFTDRYLLQTHFDIRHLMSNEIWTEVELALCPYNAINMIN